MKSNKPFSQACENNKQAILNVLKKHLIKPQAVLEIGSGTGQHAAYFSEHLRHLQWHTSDLLENHSGINAWREDYEQIFPNINNLHAPFVLDADECPALPIENLAAIFTANTLHIMSWPQVENLFKGIAPQLSKEALWIVYGPFNYNGKYTSPSNAEFDVWLKQIPHRGIRDIEAVTELAAQQNMVLVEDNAMPANNRCLVFLKE